jgi:hypothetical protein
MQKRHPEGVVFGVKRLWTLLAIVVMPVHRVVLLMLPRMSMHPWMMLPRIAQMDCTGRNVRIGHDHVGLVDRIPADIAPA